MRLTLSPREKRREVKIENVRCHYSIICKRTSEILFDVRAHLIEGMAFYFLFLSFKFDATP